MKINKITIAAVVYTKIFFKGKWTHFFSNYRHLSCEYGEIPNTLLE